MLDDWQNDTFVGKYLKDIHKRKIPKDHKYKDDKLAIFLSFFLILTLIINVNAVNLIIKSYAGFFHTDYSGMTKKDTLL